MNGVLGHDFSLQCYIGLGITWANEMNFITNHAPGAGLIAQPVDPRKYKRCKQTGVDFVVSIAIYLSTAEYTVLNSMQRHPKAYQLLKLTLELLHQCLCLPAAELR